MTVVYSGAIKNARMLVVRDGIDAGAGPGKLKLYTSGSTTLLAVIPLADPASSVAADVLTLLGTPREDVGIADGDATVGTFTDSADAVVATLTVGVAGSGADAIIDSITVSIGQSVRVVSASIKHG